MTWDMKSYSSKDILRLLREDGWYEVNCIGDHHQFKHPTKKGKVTVCYLVKDMSIRDIKSIEKQSGLKLC